MGKAVVGLAIVSIALFAATTAAQAEVLTLTSPALQDNGTLAIKNACNDKQRSPNCVGENISPPLAWSGVPEGTKSFACCSMIRKGAPRRVSRTW